MKKNLTRREFIKMGLSSLAASYFMVKDWSWGASQASEVDSILPTYKPFFPLDQDDRFDNYEYGRVTNNQISVHSLPRDDARIVRQRFRDDILPIYAETMSEIGPSWNPLWYRVWGGYVHSAFIQKVNIQHQPVVSSFEPRPGDASTSGRLGEITVPYTQCMFYRRWEGWKPLYRLYYETVHWITGIDEGPDKEPWYQITDELGNLQYFVPTHHVRLIPDSELTPIEPDLPFESKEIQVDLASQTLFAYQDGTLVLSAPISSGIKTTRTTNGIPTETPKGKFNIGVKMPSKHMGEGRLTDNFEDYELVGVPWTSFFKLPEGYAIHGTYWHNNFGIPMSRGCINLRNADARWLFRWITPVSQPSSIDTIGFGTTVIIF